MGRPTPAARDDTELLRELRQPVLMAEVPTLGPLLVLSFGPQGFIATLPRRRPGLRPVDTMVRLQLKDESYGPFHARLSDVYPASEAQPPRALFSLRHISAKVLRAILRLQRTLDSLGLLAAPPHHVAFREQLSQTDQIRAALRPLVSERTRGILRADGGRAIPMRFTPSEGSRAHLLRIELDQPLHASSFQIDAEGFNALYRMRFNVGFRSDGDLFAPLPTDLLRIRHRLQRRTIAPPGLVIRFQHPQFPDIRMERFISDVSQDGCAFPVNCIDDALYTGLYMGRVEIQYLRSVLFTGPAWVRGIQCREDGSSSCGLQLGPADERWRNFIGNLLHPTTKIGGIWGADAWEIYEASGYFELSGKDPADFKRLHDAYEQSLDALDAAPSLGCFAVFPELGGIAAAITLLRVFPSSWLACHLAKRAGGRVGALHGGVVLRDLVFRAYEHASQFPGMRWLLAYIQDGDRWTRKMHYDFPARFISDGLAATQRFRAIQISPHYRPSPPPGWTVAPPTDHEREWLVAAIARVRPAPYVEAFSLGANDLEMNTLATEMAEVGLLRRRDLRVLRVNGQPIAFAILEVAAEGMHLFGLLDSVRVFSFTNTPTLPQLQALLADASRWYQVWGKRHYTFFDEHAVLDDFSPAGLTDMGLADIVVLSAERLQDLMEHVWEGTAPRRLLRPEGDDAS